MERLSYCYCACSPFFYTRVAFEEHFRHAPVCLQQKPTAENLFVYTRPHTAPDHPRNFCAVFANREDWDVVRTSVVSFTAYDIAEIANKFIVWMVGASCGQYDDLGTLAAKCETFVSSRLASVRRKSLPRLLALTRSPSGLMTAGKRALPRNVSVTDLRSSTKRIFGTTLSTPLADATVRCPAPNHPDNKPSARLFVDSGTVYCLVCKKSFRFAEWASTTTQTKGERRQHGIDRNQTTLTDWCVRRRQ